MTNRNDIEQLFKAHYAQMYRLAVALLHDDDLARDIVHDVFASLLDAPLEITATGSYLIKAVRNRCLNQIRDCEIHQRIANRYFLEDEEYDSEDWPDEETIALVYSLIKSKISPKARCVMELRFSDGLPFARIAAKMGISETAVYRHLSHALTIIRKNSTKMDKYELVLDAVEHPEKYTSEQLAEILSDSGNREIYNLLCKADSAIEAEKDINVDAEWENFSERHSVRNRRRFFWFGSRAASIAAIVSTSIVAVAAGIAVTVTVIGYRPGPIADIVTVAPTVADVSTDTLTAKSDIVIVNRTPIMFEDEPLEKIMKEVADAYGVEEIRFNNLEAAALHLYYKFDPSLPLNEVVEQLNTFEQINIKQNGNILTID